MRFLDPGSSVPIPTTLVIDVERGVVIDRYSGFQYVSNVDKHLDLSKCLALPGFIDMHVHLRGLELSYKEDELSGTRAAVRGGYTAVVDMPNTKPRLDNIVALQHKLMALSIYSHCDYGVYAAVPHTSNTSYMKELLSLPGVMGFKVYPEDMEFVTYVLKVLNRHKLMVVHAEDLKLVSECAAGLRWRCRSIEAELSAITKLNSIVKQYGDERRVRIHVTHVTNPLSATLAKSYGFTVDTCPHYLLLSSEHEVEVGCIAKVNPPLRSHDVQHSLISWLSMVDAVASDHAPHSLDEKELPFELCPSGISSIEIASLLVLDLALKNVIDIKTAIRLLSLGPASILRLCRWGCIARECIASYTFIDLRKETHLENAVLESKAKHTPYRGTVRLGICATMVRGQLAYHQGEVYKPRVLPLTEVQRLCV
ncbi:MAG TPA: dihydroorotase [Ignisphaera sp.]|uniref:Dihydroorotase n=1 Tax=Ignisphaera aggregans TaxID=334771 RepID=A0A832YYX9_9CREN|nr:dihydroorotase [Ignisphaera sp.]HIP56826.1 dihydroorotase [Ignisphaera aggregans]